MLKNRPTLHVSAAVVVASLMVCTVARAQDAGRVKSSRGQGGQGGTSVTGSGSSTGAASPNAAGSATASDAAGAKNGVVGADGKLRGDTTSLPQFQDTAEFHPLRPNERVAFSMDDADLPELVRLIGQITGRRFLFDSKLKSIKATVYSPQKVTVAEAYQAFLSILEANGLTVVPSGRFLRIIESTGVQARSPTYGPGQAVPAEDRYVTRMHRVSHISADEASGVLAKFKSKDADIQTYPAGNMLIMTDTGTNIRRMMRILEQIDVGSAGDQIWIEPVHYAAASDVAGRLNDLFDVKGGTGATGGAKGAAGAAGAAAAGGSPASDLHVTKVIADDRSNSLIIVATERAYLRMLELIKRVDIPQTGEGEIHVFSLQHADAIELSKTLNEIIGNAQGTPPRRGGGPAGAAGAGGAAPEGVFEGSVKVSADKSTNSLVVTSSPRDYASLRSVVDRLDQARRQVFIDAVIMDISVSRIDKLGVAWHGGANPENTLIFGGLQAGKTIGAPTDALQGAALGIRGPDIAGTANLLPGIGLSIPAFGAVVSALATSGDSDVLSTPHILALDNEPAEISIGQNIARQQNIGFGGGGGLSSLLGAAGGAAGGAASALGALGGGLGGGQPQFQDVGTKIKITAHLNESNEARLDIQEEISEAGTPEGALQVVPINKRTANTKLVVKDQETVVIGGLVRNRRARSQTKIPVLGDIPILGALFRESTDTMQKTNLILILTPYIIRDQTDLRNVFERKMQERQELLDRYFIFGENTYAPAKDYTRTNGLLETIRQDFAKVDEKRKLDELTRPKELKGHAPQTPLEMPASPRSGAAGGNTPPGQPGVPGAGVDGRVNVTPLPRNIERLEK
jgi:general secretion pathway protein D